MRNDPLQYKTRFENFTTGCGKDVCHVRTTSHSHSYSSIWLRKSLRQAKGQSIDTMKEGKRKEVVPFGPSRELETLLPHIDEKPTRHPRARRSIAIILLTILAFLTAGRSKTPNQYEALTTVTNAVTAKNHTVVATQTTTKGTAPPDRTETPATYASQARARLGSTAVGRIVFRKDD